MRAITVRQPWAWAIIHGGKDVENRSRNIAGAYRGPVAIHAGVAVDLGALLHWSALPGLRDLEPAAGDTDRGVIIGVVDLVDVHACRGSAQEPIDGCSPWADYSAGHHLILAHARPLTRPIPATGRLGLWTLPDAIAELIEVAP